MGASSGGMRASRVWSARKFCSALFAPGRCTKSPLSMLPERAPLWPSMLLYEHFCSPLSFSRVGGKLSRLLSRSQKSSGQVKSSQAYGCLLFMYRLDLTRSQKPSFFTGGLSARHTPTQDTKRHVRGWRSKASIYRTVQQYRYVSIRILVVLNCPQPGELSVDAPHRSGLARARLLEMNFPKSPLVEHRERLPGFSFLSILDETRGARRRAGDRATMD